MRGEIRCNRDSYNDSKKLVGLCDLKKEEALICFWPQNLKTQKKSLMPYN